MTLFRKAGIDRPDGVVPVAMEAVVLKIEVGDLSVRDLHAFGIFVFVKAAVDSETGSSLGCADQLHDDLAGGPASNGNASVST